MDKKTAFIVIAAFWLIVLVGFIAYKQFTVSMGKKVLLDTQPVDPRDLFRGDYMQLRYNISTIRPSDVSGVLPQVNNSDTVYVVLTQANKYWLPKSVTKYPPGVSGNDACIRGTVTGAYQDSISVKYGIESYFVPEGTGNVQGSDFDGEVSVDSACNAVLTHLYYKNGTVFEPG